MRGGVGGEGTLKTHDARDINRLKKAHTLCTAHDGKKDRGWKKNHKKMAGDSRTTTGRKEPLLRQVSLIAHSFGFMASP